LARARASPEWSLAQRVAQELKNAKNRREVAPIALIDWTLSDVAGQIWAILE